MLHLVAMLMAAGIAHTIEIDSEGTLVVVEEGYPGFYTKFEFNTDGQLVEMGAFE